MLLETEVQSRLVSNSCTDTTLKESVHSGSMLHLHKDTVFNSQGCVFYTVLNQGTWTQAPGSISNVCHGMSIRSGAEKQVAHLTAAVCKSCH